MKQNTSNFDDNDDDDNAISILFPDVTYQHKSL